MLKRLLQRLLILGLGIFVVWMIVFVIFRIADRRLPWVLALGLTYGVAAYVILPRAIRFGLRIRLTLGRVRALLRGALRLPHIDVGGGWLFSDCRPPRSPCTQRMRTVATSST